MMLLGGVHEEVGYFVNAKISLRHDWSMVIEVECMKKRSKDGRSQKGYNK